MARKEVTVWCNKFKDVQTVLKHRCRPRTYHTDENCVILKVLIRKDRRVKVREIAEVTDIAKSTVHEVISDLNFCKLTAPKMITEDHEIKMEIFGVTKMKENCSRKTS
jgi:aspartyl/asparaginyl-tRNA synthetase